MHKRKLKRNTLTQSVKPTENLSRLRDYQENQNESSDNFQLPSLQKKKTWKDADDNVQSWDRNSTATDMFCSSEIENVATKRVMQQWEAIENTLYEDGEQVTNPVVLEECIQWRTQIPHFRVIGKNPFLSLNSYHQESNVNQKRNSIDSYNEDVFSEHSISLKERKESKQKLQKTPQDEIFDMLYEHIISELFTKKGNEIDSLHSDFNDALQIRMAPIHSNRSSAKSTNLNWLEEMIPLENKLPNGGSKMVEDRLLPIRRDSQISLQEIQKNDKIKNEKNECIMEDKLFRPHTSRNKLGTVFNEKIVVSPVPYVLSTRKSFSTIKTTPVKLMTQSLETSRFQGSSRNISHMKNSASSKLSNYQSAWHAPVSPAVWPKNIKLAPLDASRLPSSKNRSATSSSVMLSRSRKPLSPISRSILPASAQIVHNSNNESLIIEGRHITPGQSSKLGAPITYQHNAGSSKNKKKRSQSNIKS